MLPLLRFTLDLFEHDKPQAVVESRHFAIENDVVRPLTSSPVEGALPLRHPNANHEVRFGADVVAYQLKRSSRRSIGMTVGPDGLAVSAPRWVTLSAVDAALQSKSSWILRKLAQAGERHQKALREPIDWCDGVPLPYLGSILSVQLVPALRGGALLVELDAGRPRLQISLPHSATPEQIRDRVQAWLMQQARLHFQGRISHFSPVLRVNCTRLSLSNAATRWGSASADGAIRLNWRLIHFHPSVVDYVVVHELSHLRVMDHGPRFWQTVASVLPDYVALRQQLKDQTAPHWA